MEARNSEMSRTLATNCFDFLGVAASSASRRSYSFSVEPQPAALMMMYSAPVARNASMFCRA